MNANGVDEPDTISLIIPAFNEEKYIGPCLEAALKDGEGNFHEILVIDNNSTDKTAQIAASYSGVRVVFKKEKGLTHARQCGFESSTGSVLAYIDADTLMPAGWTDQVREQFSKDSSLTCLSGPYSYYDIPALQGLFVSFWYLTAKPFYWLFGYMATGGNIIIRRKVLEQMGGFDTAIAFYGEDTYIARQAHKYGRVIFTSKMTMPTSGRRFKNEGIFKTGYNYLINFLSVALFERPITQEYKDIR